jgi:hypothetical protein
MIFLNKIKTINPRIRLIVAFGMKGAAGYFRRMFIKKAINIQPIAAVSFIKIAFFKFRVKANAFNYILLI